VVGAKDPSRPGEEVVLDLRPHWWFFSRQALALIAAIVLGIFVLAFGPSGGDTKSALNVVVAGLLVVAVVWFAVRYAVWATTNFVITTDRLVTRRGVFSRTGIEIPLERVNTVFFSQSLFERMIRSGDLVIESAGEMGSSRFTDIRRPLDVQNEIYTQMEANENRKFDRVGRNMGDVSESIPDQIAKLDDLRHRGALTNAEFEDKKAELLRRL
jgi:uncharacterized membrane protein YdbT with pleckstrin-like domain